MTLIKCPECEIEVSDQAPACNGCGYPLSDLANEDITETVNGVEINITQLIAAHKDRVDCIKTIRKKTGYGLAEAKDAFDEICMRNFGDVDPY